MIVQCIMITRVYKIKMFEDWPSMKIGPHEISLL